jgi:hypothetical protein
MTLPFEAFDFSVIPDNYSRISPAGNDVNELCEVLVLPVLFDRSPPHPTTPADEFYDTAAELAFTTTDYLAWTGELLEDHSSEGFLSSSTGFSASEPSSSSGFSLEESLGIDLVDWPLSPNNMVSSAGCVSTTSQSAFPPQKYWNEDLNLRLAPEAKVSRKYTPSPKIANEKNKESCSTRQRKQSIRTTRCSQMPRLQETTPQSITSIYRG